MEDILNKISNLPLEIQNRIFYYLINEEANLIKTINWKKEYINAFYKVNNKPYTCCVINQNVFGVKLSKTSIGTYDKYNRIMDNRYIPNPLRNFDFSNYSIYTLRDFCIINGIKKFNKNNKIKMIKLLMKI